MHKDSKPRVVSGRCALKDGVIEFSGRGLIYFPSEYTKSYRVVAVLQLLSSNSSVEFLFGFSGVGRTYKVAFMKESGMVSFFLLRNGIHVRMGAVAHGSLNNVRIEVTWQSGLIRVLINQLEIFNLVDFDIEEGFVGYNNLKGQSRVLKTETCPVDLKTIDYLVIGDGFATNRWLHCKNEVPWPAIVFRQKYDYCNGSVLSANTATAFEQLKNLIERFTIRNVILSVGVDDLIEKREAAEVINGLSRLTTFLSDRGINTWVLALTPRKDSLDIKVRDVNSEIKMACENTNSIFVDTYTAICREGVDRTIRFVDFPNQRGQQAIAKAVADSMGMTVSLMPQLPVELGLKERIWLRVSQCLLSLACKFDRELNLLRKH